ncbi:LSU ribosomal protein L23P [Balneicella halophila]|uniref:Large ribosomal subunit protein uL23 n=1 Tax=Balneicella halophila TaxID=1537566 RepID=A0A7L4URL6_BALHA|nr:50S ribosomal protein L23 [Balneicella halophila]PVX52393.1 LSU ribosomal protein L23P [Balneicella halophila]
MEIIIKPIITEQLSEQAETLNRYGFVVAKEADKGQIKRAVEKKYGVKVTAVNTMIVGGKRKSRFTKAGMITGSTNSYKKALVTVAAGDIIDFYSNI